MRALEPDGFDAFWAAVEPLLPTPTESHPLGCHRRRAPDRTCFKALLIRLVTGCSWVDAEQLVDGEVSDTMLRSRRDEWERAGVFDRLVDEAIGAYDKIIGLDLSDVAFDGSQHKAPGGGEGTGKNPADRGKLGWKWSILTDRSGIPIGWATNGANRHDNVLFTPTLCAAAQRGLLVDVETLHLDRGYDSSGVRAICHQFGLDDVICARQPRDTKKGRKRPPVHAHIRPRWPVVRTNSWLSNFGQLRRSTDRSPSHRRAQMGLAVTLLITAKLIDWRNRWSG
jgi:transposase